MSISGITEEDILSIANDFWATMTSMPLHPLSGPLPVGAREEGILGHVEIRGAWKGMVEIRASRALSFATAATLLNRPTGQVTIEECFDAIQESTNIVAGSIKRLLPPVCKIGIPAMSACSNLCKAPLTPRTVAGSFISATGLLTISVVQED